MTESLAKKYADTTGEDFDVVRERWDGAPEQIIEDLFRVRDADTREERPLELFDPYQPRAIRAYFYSDSSTINVYKGRRIGMTFVFLLCMTLDALRDPHTFYPIVCPSQKAAKKRIEDVKDILDMCILDFGDDELPTDNSDKLGFWNGSRIEAFTAGADSSRGDDPARAVFMDEMAFFEDQKQTLQAFRAFVSLGNSSKMIQVSTPKVQDDTFMQTHRRGTVTGYADDNGSPVYATAEDATKVPVSIQQASFKNPEDIDIYESLHEQDVEPVRPDMNLQAVEEERAEDPQGFAQEYLCRPISEEYRFFSSDTIDAAQERGAADDYQYGLGVGACEGGTMFMAADIGITSDDTAVTVWEHTGDVERGERKLRYYEVVDEQSIAESGIRNPDRGNPNHVVHRLADIYEQMGCEHFIYDSTGVGNPFKSIIRRRIGRGAHPFNFTDKESVRDMAHDLNYGLHNDLVTLVPDRKMSEQLKSIVKEKDEDYQTAKFTGKEYAPEGKDDVAMSVILGAYPYFRKKGGKSSLTGETDTEPADAGEFELATPDRKGLRSTSTSKPTQEDHEKAKKRVFGSKSVNRGKTYESRH